MISRIILPLDQSELSEGAIPFGILLARTFDAALEFVHVIDEPSAGPHETQEAEAYLAGLAQRFPDMPAARHVVCAGDAAEEILHAAGDGDSMIVMGTRGRGGLQRMLLGSVADRVVRTADVPVALVRGGDGVVLPAGRLTRLLVPLDSSELSELSLPFARDLAQRAGAELHLLQVVEPISIGGAAGYPPEMAFLSPDAYAGLMNDLEQQAREYLTDTAQPLRDAGITVTISVKVGLPVDDTLRTAGEVGADAIVMATHGRGGMRRVLLGSVATGVVGRGTLPLIVVPARAAMSAGTDSQLETEHAAEAEQEVSGVR
jgi:nucleotide-binding universal stress UspA family protein